MILVRRSLFFTQRGGQMKKTDLQIIREIVSIICVDGSSMTDGECLDAVWELLEANGYDPKKIAKEMDR